MSNAVLKMFILPVVFLFTIISISYWYLSFYNVNFNWYFTNYEWQTSGEYGQIEFDECQARRM